MASDPYAVDLRAHLMGPSPDYRSRTFELPHATVTVRTRYVGLVEDYIKEGRSQFTIAPWHMPGGSPNDVEYMQAKQLLRDAGYEFVDVPDKPKLLIAIKRR